MRVLIKVALVVICCAVSAPVGLALASAASVSTAGGGPGSSGNGPCFPVDLTWVCIYTTGGPGGPGGPGAGGTSNCTYVKAPASVVQAAGVGPPMPGYQWDIMTCPGQNPAPGGSPAQLVQVSINGGVPAVTPFQLMLIAMGELYVPTLEPATAPPRGRQGLVGLPEWFWVPRAQWKPASITVTAGPVWATATATPTKITFEPGGGLGSVSCPGPGTPFDRSLPAARQHTECSYTYDRSSAEQPGHAYRAGLAVTWAISWTGSGGAGGLITTGYRTAMGFELPVAQAEALVTTP
jgi:hypothetical protein